jgi:hypothetical protein
MVVVGKLSEQGERWAEQMGVVEIDRTVEPDTRRVSTVQS